MIRKFLSLLRRFREKSAGASFTLGFSPEPYAAKRASFTKVAGNVRTLAFGSSHGLYGFHAGAGEFNFCEVSQDLYYSFRLYEKHAGTARRLEKIILFFSVFSAGFELEKTGEKERCVFYKTIYGLPYKNREFMPRDERRGKEKQVRKFLKGATPSGDPAGNCRYDFFFAPGTDVRARAEAHLQNSRRENDQMLYFKKLCSLARKKGHALFIVIPPARTDYKSFLPSSRIIFYNLFNKLPPPQEGIQVLNFYDDPDFGFGDFGDMDHLNQNGAIKLTQKIKERLHERIIS